MPTPPDGVAYPELVIGLAGPIGVDTEALTDSVTSALKDVNYKAYTIRLTDEMLKVPLVEDIEKLQKDFYRDVVYKIAYANTLRKQAGDYSMLARLALIGIRQHRFDITGSHDKIPEQGVGYILRQLKRPEEVDLLRKIYGRQFILLSAYGSSEDRTKLLKRKLKTTLPTQTSGHQISAYVGELIEKDANEEEERFGQRLRETFHLGDVFVDGIQKANMDKGVLRFFHALFGRNDISPSKSEYGMYAAKSASLRSSDLSRQVGAAIFSNDGELITQGTNEVPKAFGGTYWDLEEPDFRDVHIGYDPNEVSKHELLRDIFERLSDRGWLSTRALEAGSIEAIVNAAVSKTSSSEYKSGPLASALVIPIAESSDLLVDGSPS